MFYIYKIRPKSMFELVKAESFCIVYVYTDGFKQDCGNPSVLAMGLL